MIDRIKIKETKKPLQQLFAPRVWVRRIPLAIPLKIYLKMLGEFRRTERELEKLFLKLLISQILSLVWTITIMKHYRQEVSAHRSNNLIPGENLYIWYTSLALMPPFLVAVMLVVVIIAIRKENIKIIKTLSI